MSLLEIIAVSFSLACVLLSIKKNILTWPIGIIGVVAYLILFYQYRLYADMGLQIVFIIQGFYGWYNWKQNKNSNDEIIVSSLNNLARIIYVMFIGAIGFCLGLALKKYTNASLPYVDSFASVISLTANWLMARKKIESWILWILADMVYIGLFWYKELYLSSGIYMLFLTMAITGLLQWSKKININTASY